MAFPSLLFFFFYSLLNAQIKIQFGKNQSRQSMKNDYTRISTKGFAAAVEGVGSIKKLGENNINRKVVNITPPKKDNTELAILDLVFTSMNKLLFDDDWREGIRILLIFRWTLL